MLHSSNVCPVAKSKLAVCIGRQLRHLSVGGRVVQLAAAQLNWQIFPAGVRHQCHIICTLSLAAGHPLSLTRLLLSSRPPSSPAVLNRSAPLLPLSFSAASAVSSSLPLTCFLNRFLPFTPTVAVSLPSTSARPGADTVTAGRVNTSEARATVERGRRRRLVAVGSGGDDEECECNEGSSTG